MYLVNAGYKFYVKYQGLGVTDKQTNFTMHFKANLIAQVTRSKVRHKSTFCSLGNGYHKSEPEWGGMAYTELSGCLFGMRS